MNIGVLSSGGTRWGFPAVAVELMKCFSVNPDTSAVLLQYRQLNKSDFQIMSESVGGRMCMIYDIDKAKSIVGGDLDIIISLGMPYHYIRSRGWYLKVFNRFEREVGRYNCPVLLWQGSERDPLWWEPFWDKIVESEIIIGHIWHTDRSALSNYPEIHHKKHIFRVPAFIYDIPDEYRGTAANSIIMTSRSNWNKRLDLYADLCENLTDFDRYYIGHEGNRLLSTIRRLEEVGVVVNNAVPLQDIPKILALFTYHINLLDADPDHDLPLSPRIEISTLYAVRAGCIPISNTELMPPQFHDLEFIVPLSDIPDLTYRIKNSSEEDLKSYYERFVPILKDYFNPDLFMQELKENLK